MRFGRETWSIEPPAGWNAWHEDECATMTAEPAIGALQISSALKKSEVLHEDLVDFAAEHIPAGVKAADVSAGAFVGITFCFGDEDTFWQQSYLRNGRQMLFVTYNCPVESIGLEDELVGRAIDSLSTTGAA